MSTEAVRPRRAAVARGRAGPRADPAATARFLGLRGAEAFGQWFAGRGWTPFEFQTQAWDTYSAGRSGLIHVPTGAGKTYAAYGGPLAELIDQCRADGGSGAPGRGLRVLYITPLRAVSRDIEAALRLPAADMGLGIRVESRTGDTSSSLRAKQKERLPEVLITTPESLSLMLTWPTAREALSGVRCTIVDEWHELLSSKRGTQVELALARLRTWAPAMRTWALSATIENLHEAARAAVGTTSDPVVVSSTMARPVVIESLLPRRIDTFPWAGHLGLTMLPEVVEYLDPSKSTLIFTNTRSQAERWFHALMCVKPEWAAIAGLHHGSIERDERERIEAGLKDGSVRLVVATSSLDLGVDFAPVERVMQIGSPKGIARLMQRAGRSGHRPGETCRIACVPTHGLELIEAAAVRRAVEEGKIEPRTAADKPLDVLAQHLVTCGLGGGFNADALFNEVKQAWSYRNLTRDEFEWALSLVREGGSTLRAYPNYHRVKEEDGLYRVPDRHIAQLHRLNVGTIVGEATVRICYLSGRSLGSIEENFVSQLREGQKFVFAGKVVEFVRLREMICYVRPARGTTNFTPIWGGTRLPISESLGQAIRQTLERAARGTLDSPELLAAAPIVAAQSRLSHVPAADELLVELCQTREGSHLFMYPFDGRLVHGGIAALLALRFTRRVKATFSTAVNDYGLELLSADGFDFEPLLAPEVFETSNLLDDALESINLGELAKRQFREIARVSGLVFQNYPGNHKGARQMQASSSLIYDVFREFDPGNLLLEQARREVLEKQFEQTRLGRTLLRLRSSRLRIVRVNRPTPLGFPLIVERTGARLSSQTILERIEQMKALWEKDLSRMDDRTAEVITPRRRRKRSPAPSPSTSPANA